MCRPLFFSYDFFFSLLIPPKINTFLPHLAWKSSFHFAMDPVRSCKAVALKQTKSVACDLNRITHSSHRFEPGKLLSMGCPSNHLWQAFGRCSGAVYRNFPLLMGSWMRDLFCYYLFIRPWQSAATSTEWTVALSYAAHTHPGWYNNLEVCLVSLSLSLFLFSFFFFKYIWLTKQCSASQMGKGSWVRRESM